MSKIHYSDGADNSPIPLPSLSPLSDEEIDYFFNRYDELMGEPQIVINESCEETMEKADKKSEEVKLIIKAEILQRRLDKPNQ